jgi:hypothetical protein
MRRTGGNAQDRRRTRRAAARRADGDRSDFTLSPADIAEIQVVVAAASGSTSLPLGDRDETWDAGAAQKSYDLPDDGDSYMWRDPDGDPATKAAYKLPFVSKSGGKHAVWKAITAIAAILQGGRGGVNIPDSDVAGVKAKVGAYYRKAAKKYDDDGIKPPWSASESAGETEIFAFSIGFRTDLADFDAAAFALAYAEAGPDPDGLVDRYAFWVEEFGGKPSKGTTRDHRLKENKPPEETALDAVDAYQAGIECSCGHSYAEHSGANGACAHADGRGTCRCGSFAYPAVEELSPTEIATAVVRIRPDLSGFEEEVERVVKRTLRRALAAAAGDLIWGTEEGFMDLLCDVNEQIRTSDDSFYPWATDASVKLDKVLICDDDGYYVAEITINGDGDPTVANRGEWIKVESAGWIEANDTMSGRARAAIREALTADGALSPAIPAEHQPSERLPEGSSKIEPPADALPATGERAWTATFVPEATLTEDGRAFAPESLDWRELPLSLMAMTKTSAEGGHDGAELAGRIDQIWRVENGETGKPEIHASGVFSKEDYGQMIARMVESRELRGLSVDIAPLEWERTSREEWFDTDGEWIAEKNDDGEWFPTVAERSMEDEIEALFSGDSITVITKGIIGMATVCPFPAFGDAQIALVASGEVWKWARAEFTSLDGKPLPDPEKPSPTLTASAAGHAPAVPPAEWFSDPGLTELTPMTIEADGRIFGHAWDWKTCHTAFADECVLAPHSATEYAYFHLGEIELDNGTAEPIGKITIDTGHAGQRLSRAEAIRHYDDTGTVAAYVVMGEDEFGGWFSGCVRPDLPEETLRLLRGSVLSGDWRGVNGNLELIALLACNVPGFPVPRARALVAAGEDGPEVLSLTAAGIVCECSGESATLISPEEAEEIRALAQVTVG